MTISAGNVIVGPAKSFSVDDTDIGATQGGVAIDMAYTVKDIAADQVIGALDQAMTDRKYTVKTIFLEAQLSNLAVVWGLPAPVTESDGSLALALGVVRSQPEHTLTIVGKAPSGKERTVIFNRAKVASTAAWQMSKEQESMYEVTFALFPDFNSPAGEEFGVIYDGAGTY